MKTEILNDILSVVSEVCEIPMAEIVSHVKRADVVDARCIFVYHCRRYGIPSATVASFLHRRRNSTVAEALRNHETYGKQSAFYRYMCREVETKLSQKLASS